MQQPVNISTADKYETNILIKIKEGKEHVSSLNRKISEFTNY